MFFEEIIVFVEAAFSLKAVAWHYPRSTEPFQTFSTF